MTTTRRPKSGYIKYIKRNTYWIFLNVTVVVLHMDTKCTINTTTFMSNKTLFPITPSKYCYPYDAHLPAREFEFAPFR